MIWESSESSQKESLKSSQRGSRKDPERILIRKHEQYMRKIDCIMYNELIWFENLHNPHKENTWNPHKEDLKRILVRKQLFSNHFPLLNFLHSFLQFCLVNIIFKVYKGLKTFIFKSLPLFIFLPSFLQVCRED